jgi:hypothetical protein
LERWDVTGAEGAASRSAIAEIIDRTTNLPEILADNERLREVRRGTLRAAEELRRENQLLQTTGERARRWILQVLTAKQEAPLRRLDLKEGRSLINSLASVRREFAVTREGPTLSQRVFQRFTRRRASAGGIHRP